jgi:hypothetical protein
VLEGRRCSYGFEKFPIRNGLDGAGATLNLRAHTLHTEKVPKAM